MTLRQTSDKLLIKSVAGTVLDDVVLASDGTGDGHLFYLIETSSINSDFRVFDKRGFGQIEEQTTARTFTKIGFWTGQVFTSGDLYLFSQQQDGGASPRVFSKKIAGAAYTTETDVDHGGIGAATSGVFSTMDKGMDRVLAAYAQDLTPTWGLRLFDSSLTQVGITGTGNFTGQPHIPGLIITFDPTSSEYLVLQKSVLLFAGRYRLNRYNQSLAAIGGVVNTSIVESLIGSNAASSTYRDGPIVIRPDTFTGDIIGIDQKQTSGITWTHDIRFWRMSNTGTVSLSPVTIFSSTPATGPDRTAEQAGFDAVVLSNGNVIVPIEVLDFPGPANAKLLVVNGTNGAVLQTIDLGAPGQVKIVEEGNRIYVLHQEVTGGTSNIYLKTFADDTLALPPMGLRLKDATSGSTATSDSQIVSVDIGVATTPATAFYLSETQTTQPVLGDPGFSGSQPSTFGLSPTLLEKKVYAWYTNPTTSLFPAFATIALTAVQDEAYDSSAHLLLEDIDDTFSSSSYAVAVADETFSSSANLQTTSEVTYGSSADILAPTSDRTFSSSANLQTTNDVTYSSSAQVVATPIVTYTSSAQLLETLNSSFDSSAYLKRFDVDVSFSSSSNLSNTLEVTYQSSSHLVFTSDVTYNSSGFLCQTRSEEFSSDSILFDGDAGAVMFVSDRTSGSSTHTNEQLVSLDIASGPDVVDFLVSESVMTRSHALTQSTLFGTEPQTFFLSSGDGLKTLYMWTRDLTTVSLSPDIRSIELDTVLDLTTADLVIKDRTNSSVIHTNERIVTTEVTLAGTEASILSCLFSETQVVQPNDLDPRFSTTIPQTFDLSDGDGDKNVYMWCKDLAGNMTSALASISMVTTIDLSTLQLFLTDRITGSAVYATSRIISSDSLIEK